MIWIRLLLVSLFFHGQAFAKVEKKAAFGFSKSEIDRIQSIGYIEPWQHVLGSFVGYFPGFGLGHAVQGRYIRDGQKYAIGEGLSLAVAAPMAIICVFSGIGGGGRGSYFPCGVAVLAGATFIGFKLVEIFDVIFTPFEQNNNWRLLQRQSGLPAVLDRIEVKFSVADLGRNMQDESKNSDNPSIAASSMALTFGLALNL